MIYKGYTIEAEGQVWQTWELDDDGKLDHILSTSDLDDGVGYRLINADGHEFNEEFVSVDDAKRFVDMETEQAGAL